jgi:uncharacterized oligopeptide transporter (OPT) family protein
MWSDDGWKKTRRMLGVSTFLGAFALEAGFHVGLPIGVYGIIGGLLGLDILTGALNDLRTGNGK